MAVRRGGFLQAHHAVQADAVPEKSTAGKQSRNQSIAASQILSVPSSWKADDQEFEPLTVSVSELWQTQDAPTMLLGGLYYISAYFNTDI